MAQYLYNGADDPVICFWKYVDLKMFLSFSSLLYPVANITMSVTSGVVSPSITNPFLQKVKLLDFIKLRPPPWTLSWKLRGKTVNMHEEI